MTTAELQQKLYDSGLVTTRIVTEQRGSWQWQDAFRKVWYRARLAKNGKVVWESYSRTRKLSDPQITRHKVMADGFYSAHNRSVPRDLAVSVLGARFVRDLERRGWSFS